MEYTFAIFWEKVTIPSQFKAAGYLYVCCPFGSKNLN